MSDGGKLIVIDFERIPGVSREWTLDHVRGDKQTFINEIQEAGFELVAERTIPGFEENYFLEFRKAS
jgi:predicted methyltransferase